MDIESGVHTTVISGTDRIQRLNRFSDLPRKITTITKTKIKHDFLASKSKGSGAAVPGRTIVSTCTESQKNVNDDSHCEIHQQE